MKFPHCELRILKIVKLFAKLTLFEVQGQLQTEQDSAYAHELHIH